MSAETRLPLLVVGAGIAGVTAAIEAAETGTPTVLIEKEPTIGGRVLRNHHYFPKLCPPSCGMEINTRRLERNPRVRVLTSTTIAAAKRTAHGFSVTLTHAPAYVNERCTGCGACSEVCPAQVADPFNLGMNSVKVIRRPHPSAWPDRFVLDRDACPEGCNACLAACAPGAIDLAARPTEETLEVGAVVVATGWQPYPIDRLVELGGGRYPDVIANVHMERLAAPSGPTGGKILRPSDGKPPRRVAFVQCAGSRDVNHLNYCSGVCCLASLKQALYVKAQIPDAEISIYYIDRRTPGRNEEMLTRVAETAGVRLIKGKVGKISERDGALVLRVEDVEAGRLTEAVADLAVLATGMMPSLREDRLPFGVACDDDGFGLDDDEGRVVIAGVAAQPEDVAACVRDATGAAARTAAVCGREA